MTEKIEGIRTPEEYERLKGEFEKQKKQEREKRKDVKRVMLDSDYGQLIGELSKVGGRNGIKVFVRDYEGHLFIEVRKWRSQKHYSGPHKQGITFQPDQVDALVELMQKAREELERQVEEVEAIENIPADVT